MMLSSFFFGCDGGKEGAFDDVGIGSPKGAVCCVPLRDLFARDMF